ncbi:segregation/condensation protein A [Streptomyces sioyaensis]|uniref:segregation/condensation protein A n=1 Tax=Streptomyces sioyaensis TaxID=67364 RepID=UPI0033D1F606
MPTSHDDAPRPRARRPLGRGAGEAAAASVASGTSETPEMPEAPEESGAGEVPMQPPAVEPAAGPRAGAADAPEQPEAVDAADGLEPHDAANEPQALDATNGPEAVDVPQPAAVAGEESPETDAAAAAPAEGDSGGEGTFTLRLDNFEGPFDLLLQLISKHKLDVTEVALSKVTDDFMAHIRAMGPDWDLDQTTEFLVVAATLLDLKAARLLPAAEVEDEADLALLEARDLLFARLLQYRAYKRIADIFSGRLADESRRYPRTVGLEPHLAELLPEVVISIGAEGFARLAVKAMQPKARPQVYVDHIHAPLVSVREQAEVVMVWLREAGEASFAKLVADAPDTLTVVARFLALLELYRERVVALEQEEALGELMVRWTGTEGAAPQVTDEFDREPGQPAAGEEPAEQAEEEQS